MCSFPGAPNSLCLQSEGVQECVSTLDRCAGVQLVVVILPGNRGDYYSAVKRKLVVNMGIPSQCVVSRTLFKKPRLMSVATKIAIQINCKLGGEPWGVSIPVKLQKLMWRIKIVKTGH
ncbi:Piwi-like protein 4 [Portunus trituberculatus]|uniref:Piwi-like protein 4 n=1 Tax=Portunus trituberculatus TaxID=210409 RepID=A0A5B7J518_PORTR|nr:Piwi-like protein 4 [Portunus trituberculatus]